MAGVAWSRDQAPKAKPAQHGTHRAFGHYNAELGLDRAGKVGSAPADDTMFGQVRAGTNPRCHPCLLLG